MLQNVRKVLKPDGIVLFRDYATGDLAQERFTSKEQRICENFYVRGDGTRAFYFSDEWLSNIFKENGFDTKEHILCCKEVENRSREIIMKRRWVQAVFCSNHHENSSSVKRDTVRPQIKDITQKMNTNVADIDISEGIAADMFGLVSACEETIEVLLRGHHFKIKVLSKEYQHTCKSTGMMLWDSARLMASVLAENESIVSGKKVLELGSGCSGICSMIASKTANLVVATDGDSKALSLLNLNLSSNLEPSYLKKLAVKKLEWGNRDEIEATKQLSGEGFEVIIGTDVTYVAEAILPLFETATELIDTSQTRAKNDGPALILCHVLRRVDEPSILAAASRFGFRLVDRWPEETSTSRPPSIISTWLSNHCQGDNFRTGALNILYFSI